MNSTHTPIQSSDIENAKYWFFAGIDALQKSQYEAAESAFQKSLDIIPDRASTLTNLSSALIQLNKFDRALSYASRSVEIDQNNSQGWMNLGVIEKNLKNYNQALSHFDRAIAIKPDYYEAWSNKGITLYEIKRYEEALIHYDQSIKIKPDFAEAWLNKGLSLNELKRYEEALNHYDHAIQINPDYASAWSNKGLTLNALKRYEEALIDYDHAIQINPNLAEAWSNKGITLNELSHYEEAMEHYDHAIQINPDFADAWANKGLTLNKLKRHTEALTHYDRAIQLNPEFADAWSNKGITLNELKRHEEALTHYDRAIQLKPDLAMAWSNKGIALNDINRFEEALTHYEQAIRLNPDFAGTWSNRGVTLNELKRHTEALTHFERALQINPEYPSALFNKSLTKLIAGEFQEGWNLYEYRWHIEQSPPYRFPHLNRLESIDNIKGKKILVWHEQGYGDSIQFSRYLPLLTKLGAHVTFDAPKALLHLLQGQFECEIINRIDTDNHFDFEIPLLSLPKLFNTDIDSIPQTPKIEINTSIIRTWKEKLDLSETMPNIGIAVSGNPENKSDRNRSMPLSAIEPLLGTCKFFVIQKGMKESDREFLEQHPEIIYLGDQISDFCDTAAIIENMDSIISVCTSITHLAGTLNKKTFLMLAWSADWRWLLNRSDSPWYPSICLFRQKQLNDWTGPINEIKDIFARFLKL